MLACRFFVSPVLLLTSLCSATALLPHIQSFINQSPAVVFIYSYCSWFWLSSPLDGVTSNFLIFFLLLKTSCSSFQRPQAKLKQPAGELQVLQVGVQALELLVPNPNLQVEQRELEAPDSALSTSNQLQEHRQNFKSPLQSLKESTQQSHFQKDLQWCWIAVLQKLPLSQLEKWAARCTHVQVLNPCR